MGVGPRRANNIEDVTLVQFLLNLWLQHRSNARLRQRTGAGAKSLTVDGLIGPKTKAQILLFQRTMRARGISNPCDGCIDKMPNNANSYGGRLYTIFLLDEEVMKLYGLNVVDMRGQRPEFPKNLLRIIEAYYKPQGQS